jgi:hypothetical protein
MTRERHVVVIALALVAALPPAHDLNLPFARLALGLILCSLVALLAALALKRFLRKGGRIANVASWLRDDARKIAVLESQRISPNADVCRIATADKEYLVVISPGAALLLHEKARAPAGPQTSDAP